MTAPVQIRAERAEDRDSIAEVTRLAFGAEAEVGLIDELRGSQAFIPELSLVATEADHIVGHAMLSHAWIRTATNRLPILALGPMAVTPARQRQGVGSALVAAILRRAEASGHRIVIVLGHPEFYPRFGFSRASQYGVRSTFKAPDAVFMLALLAGACPDNISGIAEYAEPFSRL